MSPARARNRFVFDPAAAAAVAAHVQEMRRRELRAATVRLRRETVRRFAEFVAPVSVLDAGAVDVERWFDALIERGLAAGSRAVYLGQLREFFRWATRRGLVGVDPTEEVVRPRVIPGLPHPISEAELGRALAAADGLTRAWLLLGAFCGLRAGEIARLRREHIRADLPAPQLRVVDGKGGRHRVVPLPTVVVAALGGWLTGGPGRLWLDGLKFPANVVSCSVAELFRELGIELTAHSLRHRYATEVYRRSRDVVLVQQLLGHASINTTMTYVRADTDRASEIVEQLAAGLDVVAQGSVVQCDVDEMAAALDAR